MNEDRAEYDRGGRRFYKGVASVWVLMAVGAIVTSLYFVIDGQPIAGILTVALAACWGGLGWITSELVEVKYA